MKYDCVVIGAGAAGMTAAIYLKRSNLNVLLIEKEIPGGQINNTWTIDNYPGLPNVSGPDLASKMFEQVTNLRIESIFENVISIKNDDFKTVKTSNKEIKAKSIVIATGRKPRLLGLKNEEKLIGKGISFCSLCDGFFYKDKIVAVIGGGNSALEGALYLAGICKEVILIHRRDQFRADELNITKVKNKSNIKILFNSEITKINGDVKLESIVINNELFNVSGIFIYIGHEPDLNFIDDLKLELNNGYIIVDKNMKTNIPKIYACGDIIKKEVYQIATAIGEGAVAATSLKKDLE